MTTQVTVKDATRIARKVHASVNRASDPRNVDWNDRVDALLADKKASSHWLNQFMRECMALRDAIEAEDGDAAKNQLAAAAERRERWLDDWRAGRDSGAVPIESQGRSMLGMFVGQRMADMFGGRPSGDKGRK